MILKIFLKKLVFYEQKQRHAPPPLLTLAEEDRDVVGAEIASGLDADEKRRAATSGHQLSGEVGGLEGQGEGSFLQSINSSL